MMTQERKSKRQLVDDYIEKYSPYEKVELPEYNILQVVCYAKKKGCKVEQLTLEEIEQFKLKKE